MTSEIELVTTPITETEIEQIDSIELLFFAYREFISDPDRILSEYAFGRAHHRALYFVNRNPGMTVADLLEILGITKQSLSRVLRELIEAGYISQTEDKGDRRKRLLFPTNEGRKLILALSAPQSERITKAMASIDEQARPQVMKFLREMISRR